MTTPFDADPKNLLVDVAVDDYLRKLYRELPDPHPNPALEVRLLALTRSHRNLDLEPAALSGSMLEQEHGREHAEPAATVTPLRSGSRDRHRESGKAAFKGPTPLFDSFQLLAAASSTDHRAVLCHSQTGLWTLEVFVGTSAPDQKTGQGYLLLTVHPDHRVTYEGRAARVFVNIGDQERVLAEEAVRDGQVYAVVSLAGLDLWTRDAVNVVFGPGQESS